MSSPLPGGILDQHAIVLGKTRSGKSSVMRDLVEDLLDQHKPVCIVDPKGDWWGIKLAADGRRPGYPVVIFGGEHADVPITEGAGAQIAELFATGNRPCLIDLGGWMVGPRTRFWIDFASTLFRLTKGDRWLVVDECHHFAPKGKVFDADSGKMLHWSCRLSSEGLGKGLRLLEASQRPQKVHNDKLTSAETLIAMRVLHPSDRGAVADWIKGCGDASGAEVLASLAQMERGEGWVWSPEIGFGPKRVKFPMFSTYDSFRPQTVDDAKNLTGWAEVDLDEVRARLAAEIEKATANDPAKLRRRIAELEKALASKAPVAGPPPAPREIRVEVVPESIREAIFRVAEKGQSIVDISAALKSAGESLGGVALLIRDLLRTLPSPPFGKLVDQIEVPGHGKLNVRTFEAPPLWERGLGEPSHAESSPPTPPTATEQKRTTAPPPGPPLGQPDWDALSEVNGLSPPELKPGERAVLVVIAERPEGATSSEIGVQTGYKKTSRDTYLSGLRTKQCIMRGDAGPRFFVTPVGRAALGPDFKPMPKSDEELRAFWKEKLTDGEWNILTVVGAHPDGATGAQIMLATKLKKTSKDTYVSSLVGRRLVERRGKLIVTPHAWARGELPTTGEELRRHYLETLPPGEAKLLKVAIEAYPEQVSRAAVDELVKLKKTSRDTYLSKLLTRRLITTDPGFFRASDGLFG